LQITCHKHNLKPILTDYIYLISYKIAKKANPVKWICPYLKTISQLFDRLLGLQIYSRNRKFGVDDFKSYRKHNWMILMIDKSQKSKHHTHI
jgi:hypothetical protein